MEQPATPKEITYPGMILSKDRNFLPGRGAISTKEGIIALFVGLKETKGKYVHVIPLNGLYTSQIGHKVIGRILDKTPTKWLVDINSKSIAVLKPQDAAPRPNRNARFNKKESRKKGTFEVAEEDVMATYQIGDYIMAKILSGDRINEPEITTLGQFLGKINTGRIITIAPPKIPRVIGKRGSMIKLLKEHTKCKIFVTQNGRIWINGRNEAYERLLVDAIYKIEAEAHTSGLTDRIKYFLITQKEKLHLE